MLEAAYREWANTAEIELEAYTGQKLSKRGVRGTRPNMVWRAVIPEQRPPERYPREAALQWMRGLTMELQRVGATVVKLAAEAAESGAPAGAEDDSRSLAGRAFHPDPDPEDAAEADGSDSDDDEDEQADAEGQGLSQAQRRAPTGLAACHSLAAEVHLALQRDAPAGAPPDDVAALHADLLRAATSAVALLGLGTSRGGADARQAGAGGAANAASCIDDVELARCRTTLLGIRERVDAAVAKAEAEGRASDSDMWKQWVTQGISAGARNAHAYSRLPEEWRPTEAPTEGGTLSASPEALLSQQRDKHRAHWRPADGPIRYQWGDRSELRQLTVAELRDASASFRTLTAVTYDGFHPRHVACLADEGIAALSTLLAAVELVGTWPPQVALVVAALLPKARGGFRSIGLMPAVYRVWAKARRSVADDWESRHARPYLAAAKGNGAIDTMWRLNARHEAGVGEGLQAGAIAEDLRSFFETIGRERLVAEAAALGFPLPLVRAALGAYANARVMVLQGRVARELYPTRGVVAGCSLATTLVKVFYVRSFDTFIARAPPGVILDAYIDDATLSMVGGTREVIIHLTRAHEELAAIVRGELQCEFAEGKTAITASSREVAEAISKAVGMPQTASGPQCFLGVDNAAGAGRRAIKRGSKKADRLKKALRRRARLSQLATAVGGRAVKVFRSGLLPSAAYDAPVWGVDGDEALSLRRLAATAMAPRARGRSLTATHMWYGHPTAEAEVAPIVQYGKMVWKAVTASEEARRRGTSLVDLRQMWVGADAYIGPVVNALRKTREEEGKVSLKRAREAWGRVKGPIGAAALSLERIGWSFTGPFEIADERGATFALTATSPALLRDILKQAVRRADERTLAAQWAKRDPQYRGRRACLDLAIKYSRPGASCSPKQCGAFKSVVCGALMTADRAQRLGYDVDGQCPLCKAARDTPRHRVYGCSATEAVVRAAVPAWFWQEAQRAAPTDSFWTTAAFPHPADVAPPPTPQRYVQVEVFPEAERASEPAMAAARLNGHVEAGHADPRTPDQKAQLGGRVYFDGSCRPSPIRDLARAACSIVEVNDGGDPIRTIEATVPWDLPQSAQCAENLAIAMGFGYVRREAEFVGDCLNVVRTMGDGSGRALKPSNRYAGLVLATHSDPARRRLVRQVRWTKAHRAATGREGEEEARDIKANALADALAKSAVSLHPPLGQHVEAMVEYYIKRAPLVVRAVAAAMDLFPPAPKALPRIPRPASEQQARTRRQHLWTYRAGAWRCTICRDWLNARRLPAYRRRQQCAGRSVDDEASVMAARGHQLCRVESQLPFIMCTRCGAWGNRRARGLAASCAAPTAAGAQALKRLGSGWHPMLRRSGPCGTAKCRDRVEVTHTFCPRLGQWLSLRHRGDAEQTTHRGSGGAAADGATSGAMEVLAVDAGSGDADRGRGGDPRRAVSAHAADGSGAGRGDDLRTLAARDDGDAEEPTNASAESAGGPRAAIGAGAEPTPRRDDRSSETTRAVRRRVGAAAAAHAVAPDYAWRAIESIATNLRTGARDGASRLQQVRDRVRARTLARPHQPVADAPVVRESLSGATGCPPGEECGESAPKRARVAGNGDAADHRQADRLAHAHAAGGEGGVDRADGGDDQRCRSFHGHPQGARGDHAAACVPAEAEHGEYAAGAVSPLTGEPRLAETSPRRDEARAHLHAAAPQQGGVRLVGPVPALGQAGGGLRPLLRGRPHLQESDGRQRHVRGCGAWDPGGGSRRGRGTDRVSGKVERPRTDFDFSSSPPSGTDGKPAGIGGANAPAQPPCRRQRRGRSRGGDHSAGAEQRGERGHALGDGLIVATQGETQEDQAAAVGTPSTRAQLIARLKAAATGTAAGPAGDERGGRNGGVDGEASFFGDSASDGAGARPRAAVALTDGGTVGSAIRRAGLGGVHPATASARGCTFAAAAGRRPASASTRPSTRVHGAGYSAATVAVAAASDAQPPGDVSSPAVAGGEDSPLPPAPKRRRLRGKQPPPRGVGVDAQLRGSPAGGAAVPQRPRAALPAAPD